MSQEIVIVKMRDGKIYRGVVTSKMDWNAPRPDGPRDWDVEFVHDETSYGRTGDPGRLKEAYDRQHQGVVDVTFIPATA